MTGRRDLAAESARRRARADRRLDRQAALARPLLAVIERGPGWLYRRVPDGVYVALLRPVQTQDDREAAAVYRASCERSRAAQLAEREANGPGCPYCPNEELTTYDAGDGDRYRECVACGANWPIGPSPDDDNPYDQLRPLRSATDDEQESQPMEDTNVFALINPAGELRFRTGVPDAMWTETDPHFDTTSGFQVTHLLGEDTPGMRGYVGDVSANHPDKYEPNPVAERVVAAIVGRPLLEVYGNLTLCGHQLDDVDGDRLAGLSAEQQATIRAAHAQAVGR